MPDYTKEIRCTRCRSEFSRDEIAGAHVCPECSSSGVPMLIADDVDLRINWHELRCLTMWASNYAKAQDFPRDSREALAAILHAIALQHPALAERSPLTLFGEIEQLRRAAESGELTGQPTTVETNVRDLLDDDA